MVDDINPALPHNNEYTISPMKLVSAYFGAHYADATVDDINPALP